MDSFGLRHWQVKVLARVRACAFAVSPPRTEGRGTSLQTSRKLHQSSKVLASSKRAKTIIKIYLLRW